MGRRVSPWVTQSHWEPICSVQGEWEAQERRGRHHNRNYKITAEISIYKFRYSSSWHSCFQAPGLQIKGELGGNHFLTSGLSWESWHEKRKAWFTHSTMEDQSSTRMWTNNDQEVWCYIIFFTVNLPRCLSLPLYHPLMRGLRRTLCELVNLIYTVTKVPGHQPACETVILT